MVDAIGRLIQGRVSAGQVHDVTQAGALLKDVPAKYVVADKAYDAMALRQEISKPSCSPTMHSYALIQDFGMIRDRAVPAHVPCDVQHLHEQLLQVVAASGVKEVVADDTPLAKDRRAGA